MLILGFCFLLYFLKLTGVNGFFKDKVATLLKKNKYNQTVYGRVKKLSKSKAQKQSEDSIFRKLKRIFKL